MADDQLEIHQLRRPLLLLLRLHVLDSALVDRLVEVVDSCSVMAVVRIVDGTDTVDNVDTVAMDGHRIVRNNMVNAVVHRVHPEKNRMVDVLAFRRVWAFLRNRR